MTASRRLSQAISEGDGISLIVAVDGPEAAAAAEADGAEAVFISQDGVLELVRGVTTLPVLAHAWHEDSGADACIVASEDANEHHDGIERVIQVSDEDALEDVLERLDPELFLLAAGNAEDPLQRVLDLLSDVPAGKLAIADVGTPTREAIEELERAGVDAVLLREPLPAS
ncbi:MAG TPA: hypothetical protein VNI55_10185 [Gaiellaceae bacterium]|nr:hypothetical protein [Gaiellaceae bacterium]